jgi:peptidoglycan/xylan/chitin deacetylase (PgdA/CDA1 family)
MFHRDNINGQLLNDKQLCLTFDDGPGVHTLPIALFLNQFNIRATFFVVGKYATDNIDILLKLKDLGHIVANHTFEHPDMPYYCSVNGDVQDQIIRTNSVIKPYVNSELVYFRAPYGKWSAEVADELNENLKSSINMCGPIYWEIPGIDCHYWNIGKSVEEAIEAYLFEVNTNQKGIIVMHDEIADMDIVKSKNKTYELVQGLIPQLIDLGYQFVGLDQIEGLNNAESALNTFYIKSVPNQWIGEVDKQFYSLTNKNNGNFKLIENGNGKISIKSNSGVYIAVDEDNLNKVVTSSISNPYSMFDYIPVRHNGFMLRSYNGNYLNIDSKDNRIMAVAQFMRQATIFYYFPVHSKINRIVSFSERLKLFKKGIQFVKSKIFSR